MTNNFSHDVFHNRPPAPVRSAPITTESLARPATSSGSPKKIAAAFLAGAVVTGAGFGLGRFTADPAPTDATSVDGRSSAFADDSVTADGDSTAVDGDADAGPRIDQVSGNPAAIVAQTLGPSVVQIETNLGLGSGVVYADGMILTNDHVISGASQIQVRSDDGRAFVAELVGSDPRNDIAVLSVGADAALPVATLADGDLQVGQTAIAIGSPFQLQQTVTAGIVSALDRPVPNDVGGFDAMIQTDTAINPGNSGGALADRDGRVIGINTSIRTDGTSNGNVGIGFAVPISTALDVANRIVSGEPLEPGVLGISGGGADDEVGVLVNEVTPGSGASHAGIQVGDRILTIDGAPVSSFAELAGLVQSSFSGDAVELVVLRGSASDPLSVVATLG